MINLQHWPGWCGTMAVLLPLAALAQDRTATGPRTPDRPTEAKLFEHLHDAFANPQDTPGRPRVLLIGDSISIGYTVPVRESLGDRASVYRPPVNCQDTGFGLAHLKEWLGTGRWDVIHFNWGIWDTHFLDNKTGQLIMDETQRSLDSMHLRRTPAEYAANLTQLVKILQGTGARLIWASSTPVMFRKGSRFEDVPNCNAAAAPVMRKNGVAIDDLYAFTLPKAAEWQMGDQCHFNAIGNRQLGDKVGQAILDALSRRPDLAY